MGGQTSQEERYYISSLAPDAELLASAIRTHWSIENPLHGRLWGDRTEAEDINSASALGRRVGDDHALGDI